MARIIACVGGDAFFASVERQDNPAFSVVPVVDVSRKTASGPSRQ
jgi:nucleotidyltransferase/DNA polymerase involved in DNA repair